MTPGGAGDRNDGRDPPGQGCYTLTMHLPPLVPGTLLKRYQRFLADVRLSDGTMVTAHCPNSGSMRGCAIPGSPVWLSRHDAPSRRYPYTWELVSVEEVMVAINTAFPNRLVRDGIKDGFFPSLAGYDTIRSEVPYGREGSRIDLLLQGDRGRCWIEIKSVTLVEGGRALFPDAVTTRGQKHLRELREMVRQGDRGVVIFVVQRADGNGVSPADAIDPLYGTLLRDVAREGVELLACRALVSTGEITLSELLPLFL